MHYKESLGTRIYVFFAYLAVTLFSIACIYPILHILALSFSSRTAVNAGLVNIIPVDFTLEAYRFVMEGGAFFTAFQMSVKRTILGVAVSMVFTVLAGYPLSKTRSRFSSRNVYMWFFVFTMLFSGGLIPGYIVVNKLGLIDTIWALVLPGAVPVYYVILFQNFIKSLPEELIEAAYTDGAGELTILQKIILPLSKPILATLTLFIAVNHWNSWFDGMIYMNRPKNYPLQTYLQTIVVQIDVKSVATISDVTGISPRNSKAAQIILAMLPIVVVYPFLQKYFTKGIVMGSVKG